MKADRKWGKPPKIHFVGRGIAICLERFLTQQHWRTLVGHGIKEKNLGLYFISPEEDVPNQGLVINK